MGARVRELREGRNLTQEQLHDALEKSGCALNRNTIGNLELEKRDPYLSTVRAIADFFGVTLDWLVYERGPRSPGEQVTNDVMREQIARLAEAQRQQAAALSKLSGKDTGEQKSAVRIASRRGRKKP